MSEIEQKYIEERLGHGLSAELPIEVFQDRFARCRKLMAEKGLEALLVYSSYAEVLGREWARYFVNYVYSLFPEETLLLIPLDSEPVFLINAEWMTDVIKKESPIVKDIRPLSKGRFEYATRYGDMADTLKSVLKERRLERARIGLGLSGGQGDFSPRMLYQVIEEGCSEARLEDASALLFELVQMKTDFDIEMIRKAVAINCEGIKACFGALGEGKEEYQGYLAFQKAVMDRGVDMPPFFLLTWSGPTAEMILRPQWATARKLKKGDMYFIDPGICYKGYYSDLRRSAVIGQPSREQQKLYDLARKGLARMVDKLRVGVRASEIAEAWLDEVSRSGYKISSPLIGHGVGILCNEPPLIFPGSNAIIQENAVVSLESLVHVPGGTGAPIEDTYLVTDRGPERLPTDSQELYVA